MRAVKIVSLIVIALAFSVITASAAASATGEEYLLQGTAAARRGSFEEAVVAFTAATRAFERERDLSAQGRALIRLAHAYQALGQYRNALATLELAISLARPSDDRQRAETLAQLGNACIVTGPASKAERYFKEARDLARKAGDVELEALVLNDLGNALASQRDDHGALGAYEQSAHLGDRVGRTDLVARALLNAARVQRVSGGNASDVTQKLDRAVTLVKTAPPSHDTVYDLITAAIGYRNLRPTSQDAAALTLRAGELLTNAIAMSQQLGDDRAASYALGYLGSLYEDEQRWEEALRLTRQAVFAAQRVKAPEALYRWQWQIGRILRRQQDIEGALKAYSGAVGTLQSIRGELTSSYSEPGASFRERLGALYFELADLLLERSDQEGAAAQVFLEEARDTVELLKVAELRDYFRDDCVETVRSKAAKLETVSPTAAVVYPLLLSDRTDLLLSLPGRLKRVTVGVDNRTLTGEVYAFRLLLEKRTTREFLPYAQRLYDWLIRPIEGDLVQAGVDTLIFVPDGVLRTVPLAALHDGERFLVQKLAVATTPGLTLTDPRPVKRENPKVLAVGLTSPALGFPALPHVANEVKAVVDVWGGRALLDSDFKLDRLASDLKNTEFSIVHIASHGQFSGNPQDSFLVAADGKLTMDQLNDAVGVFRFRDQPLDLLTLSACQTAAGDDRAALGMAGVAIKAGARSALATLWYINDQASADLVTMFYRNLRQPGTSRVQALQRAQTTLMSDPRYDHPSFWAPFLLINNWL